MNLHVREIERIGAQHPQVRHVDASPSGISTPAPRSKSARASAAGAYCANHSITNGTTSSTPSTRVSAAKNPIDSGDPPRSRAHVVERRDRQHEEERFGVDRREEDGRRKDRNVEDRAARDRAVVFVLEQLIEIEQAEEERGVRNRAGRRSGGCRRALRRLESAADRAGRTPCRCPDILASRCRCSGRRPSVPRPRAAGAIDSCTCVPAR